MEAKKWKTKISANLKQIKVEPKQYEAIINTLADILEQRDACLAKYIEDGAIPIMEYTNKGGATNTVKNPLLILWTDLNTQALSYWRELGLTPSAYKKMTGGAKTEKENSALVEALKSIETG